MKKLERIDVFENKHDTTKDNNANIIDLEEMLSLNNEEMIGM